jgi:hypothetical protein
VSKRVDRALRYGVLGNRRSGLESARKVSDDAVSMPRTWLCLQQRSSPYKPDRRIGVQIWPHQCLCSRGPIYGPYSWNAKYQSVKVAALQSPVEPESPPYTGTIVMKSDQPHGIPHSTSGVGLCPTTRCDSTPHTTQPWHTKHHRLVSKLRPSPASKLRPG